jgi:hypothetical protein
MIDKQPSERSKSSELNRHAVTQITRDPEKFGSPLTRIASLINKKPQRVNKLVQPDTLG